MNRLNLYSQILKNMGGRYFLFRASYEMQRKSGLLRFRYPVNYTLQKFFSLEEWKEKALPFFFDSSKEVSFSSVHINNLASDFHRVVKGECCFFSSAWYDLGTDCDWVTNPDTNYKYDVSKHWTEVEDIVQEAGDIKYVWEKSRFSYLYTVIRYDHSTGEDHSQFVFDQIQDWIDKNPLNCGPNYKCSQEISLRVLNWIFALYYYKSSPLLTESCFQKIINSIYWQIKHVYGNINFSRIAVRNNHAITETLTLYIVGLLFPWFPDAKLWKSKGKKWFEKEIEYQIAEDGTYLQFSMNYHRVVIQLLTWGIALAQRNGECFSEHVYQRAYQSVNFLYQCQELSNGYLPNYGSNDGALFFKLNDSDYRDYRPQLDALHYLLTGENLYDDVYEDRGWYANNRNCIHAEFAPLKQKIGCFSFDVGGYYLIREQDTLTFIRCGKYKDRPAHADNLHMDVWYKGENILMDGGSYKYNTDASDINYFMGTQSHNTIMLGNNNQMLKGARFMWFYWSQALKASIQELDDSYCFSGVVSCFRQLGHDIAHSRKIIKKKNAPEWMVEDIVLNKPQGSKIRQLWHTQSSRIDFKSVSHNYISSKGMYSEYYGQKKENKEIEFISDSESKSITTIIQVI